MDKVDTAGASMLSSQADAWANKATIMRYERVHQRTPTLI